MKQLYRLNRFFWKYRRRFLLGILFIVLSNYFKILAPQLTGIVIDNVQLELLRNKDDGSYRNFEKEIALKVARYDPLVKKVKSAVDDSASGVWQNVLYCCVILLILALFSGFFMFLMRQTIIVMSRHIEYEQKNQVFSHYLSLDLTFYKKHAIGDLMNRISEDVSRVRMYTGPALMYFTNLAATIGFSLAFMFSTQPVLTLYILAPLPILAVVIYYVNTLINKKSERIQELLSDLTTNAQESYSGIRVIKSFVQEQAMFRFFSRNSEAYRESALGLAKMEAVYFPAIGLLIGLSTLLTVMIGGIFAIQGTNGVTAGTITEFVMYVNMLTFPVSAIGWTASMIQRAAASQKRINEFLETQPAIKNSTKGIAVPIKGDIMLHKVSYRYPNTGIQALQDFNLNIKAGERIAIVGHTGSGKTTLAQILLRLIDPDEGIITIDGRSLKEYDLTFLRKQVSYVPQDVFLFSDSIEENIGFGMDPFSTDEVRIAARNAYVEQEILGFKEDFQTRIGERGVTLSGGQKQRVSIARALIKDPSIIIFDDCLSAVDTKTEKAILHNLDQYLKGRTALIITHRIFSLMDFDQIIVLEEGKIVENGRHEELMKRNGYYRFLYDQQRQDGVILPG